MHASQHSSLTHVCAHACVPLLLVTTLSPLSHAQFPVSPINDTISHSPFQPAPPVRALLSNEPVPLARSPFRVKMFPPPQQQVRLGTNGVGSPQDNAPPTTSAGGGNSRHQHIVAPKFPSTRPVGQVSYPQFSPSRIKRSPNRKYFH